MNNRNELLNVLRTDPKNTNIPKLIKDVEAQTKVDLQEDLKLLEGVWELKWSSSKQTWLKQAPWLDNLQVLDPQRKRAVNLLKLRGAVGNIAVITVEAELTVDNDHRIGVKFVKGGWVGPTIMNGWRPKLLANVNQTFPAWLEITSLDDTLRICRGNAGTCFCLTKRSDLKIEDWIPRKK